MEIELHISSPQLLDFLNFKDIDVEEDPSQYSLCRSILNSIDFNRSLNEIRSASRSVKLTVLEVDVIYDDNSLKVAVRGSANADEFLRSSSQNTKVLWIHSRAVRVIEAKLAVYNAYKPLLNLKNTLIHHEFEKCDDICAFSIGEKLEALCESARSIKENIPNHFSQENLERVADNALSKEKLREICNEVDLWDGEQRIGRVNNQSYVCNSQFTIDRIANTLRKKTLEGLAIVIASDLCQDILKDLESKMQADLKREFLRHPIVIPERYLANNLLPAGIAMGSLLIPGVGPFIALATLVSTFAHRVDFNSETIRNKVADGVHYWFSSGNQQLIQNIFSYIEEVCKRTKMDLESICKQIKDLKNTIAQNDQHQLVREWLNREIIENKENMFIKYPSIIQYIAGRRNGNTAVKVFLGYDDKEAKDYFLRTCSVKDNIQFVNITKLLKEKSDKQKAEKTEYVIAKNTRHLLQNIIEREGEKIMANHSTICAIGVGLNHRFGDPCIVLFCLDDKLIPFGEKEIPTRIEGYPTFIRYD